MLRYVTVNIFSGFKYLSVCLDLDKSYGRNPEMSPANKKTLVSLCRIPQTPIFRFEPPRTFGVEDILSRITLNTSPTCLDTEERKSVLVATVFPTYFKYMVDTF